MTRTTLIALWCPRDCGGSADTRLVPDGCPAYCSACQAEMEPQKPLSRILREMDEHPQRRLSADEIRMTIATLSDARRVHDSGDSDNSLESYHLIALQLLFSYRGWRVIETLPTDATGPP